MKKLFPAVVIFLTAMVLWNVFIQPGHFMVDIDGDSFDGPVGIVFGSLLAGGGMLLAAVIVISVGLLLTVLFAGLGILLVVGLVLGAVCLAAVMSPLMLPLLIPAAIIWTFHRRNQRDQQSPQRPAHVRRYMAGRHAGDGDAPGLHSTLCSSAGSWTRSRA